jgi:hypothetical protein
MALALMRGPVSFRMTCDDAKACDDLQPILHSMRFMAEAFPHW